MSKKIVSSEKDLITLLQKEIKSSDTRYLSVRSKLLQTLNSNAQLLEYIQHVEDQLSFYKQKVLFNDKKAEIDSSEHALPTDLQFNDTEENDSDSKQSNSQINMQVPSPNFQIYEALMKSLASPALDMKSFLSSITSALSFAAASVYSINRSLQKISCELSTLSHLNKNYSSSVNEGVLSQVIQHRKTIIIQDVNDTNIPFNPETDDRFYGADTDQGAERRTYTLCLEPLYDEKNEMIGILELIHTQNKSDEYAKNEFKYILQLSNNIASNLLSNILIKREFNNSNIHKEALLELAKVMSYSNNSNKDNIENLIEKVRQTVYKSVKCDKVALFLVDEIRQELWCNASDDVAGIRLPLNKGIVGHTVTTGESLNIIDAYQDSRFNPSVDKKTNYRTKSILCVPITYNNKIIGAMECINKANDESFTETDVSLLKRMAEETAPSLQNKFMQSALRIITQGLQDSSSKDYLSQFMHDEDYAVSAQKKKDVDQTRGSEMVDSPKIYLKISSSIKHGDICTWNFDYFALIEDNYQTAIPMMVYMFNDFGLLEQFNISEKKLYAFLIAVKGHYYDNPYHNFLHAFSVMHVCYLVLKTTSMSQHFTILDVLTMFISALCHDLEHPGLTNAYQVNSGSDLAMRYNDKSVLENHHAHVGSVLLKKPETAILSGLSNDERNKARKSMISIILHTDMSFHQNIVTDLLQFTNKKEDEITESDKLFLSETLVHLGDLSNPVMRWDQSHEWSLRVIDEFIAQSELEKERKLKLSMAFITDKSPEAVSKVQTSFIDYVVKPLWKNAKNIAPELQDRLNVLDTNRQNWSDYPSKYDILRQKKC